MHYVNQTMEHLKIYSFECREETLEKLKKTVCCVQNRNYVSD